MMRYIFIFFIMSAFPSRAQDAENFVTATDRTIQRGDSLYKIAHYFDLGMDEILQANPNITDPNIIHVGEKIILPTTHLPPDVKQEGIVINLAEPRLYFFLDGQWLSFPISIGADEKTPIGRTKIASKVENPFWIPPASIREEDPTLPEAVPPGPNNPLGQFAFHLDGSKNYKWQSIMIHGTNVPSSIGYRVSHGCIRLYPKDIEILFNSIEVGAPVRIVNQPIKISEINNKIYIEVHLQETPDVVMESLGINKLICKKVEDCESRVDWQKVDEVVTQNLGIPVDVSAKFSEW